MVAAAASTDDPRVTAPPRAVADPAHRAARVLQLIALVRAGHLWPDELALLRSWHEGGPLFSEDVGLFVGTDREKHYVRLEATAAGRIVIHALGLPGRPRVVDIDTVTAVERLLRAARV